MEKSKECEDKKCPIHSNVRVRGAILDGKVVSNKPKNTVIVEREYLRFIPKYERYERRKTRIAAHRPACMEVQTGDRVRIGECRKLSKTKSFVVTKIIKEREKKVQKKKGAKK